MADTAARRSCRENARRADQSSGPEPDRRKISGSAELPATPGFEGAGVVVDVGANVNELAAGALVILPHNRRHLARRRCGESE